MNEQEPQINQPSRVGRLKKAAKKAGALAGITGAAVVGVASMPNKANAEPSSIEGAKTYLSTEKAAGNPVQDALASNKAEIALLQEIREGKHPAAIWNGALDFYGKTTLYLGPKKQADLKADENFGLNHAPNEHLTAYYPLITKVGNTLWAAVIDDHHSQTNSGSGSAYGIICWVPLESAQFNAWQNTGDKAPALMKFHELYDPHPMGQGVPPTPQYNIVPNGTNPQLPRPEAIMDSEFWPGDQANSQLTAAMFKQLSSQQTRAIINSLK